MSTSLSDAAASPAETVAAPPADAAVAAPADAAATAVELHPEAADAIVAPHAGAGAALPVVEAAVAPHVNADADADAAAAAADAAAAPPGEAAVVPSAAVAETVVASPAEAAAPLPAEVTGVVSAGAAIGQPADPGDLAAPSAEASAVAPAEAASARKRPGPGRPATAPEVATRLRELFPALFGGAPKPLKLRIQADIQQRAPGEFTRQTLAAFLQRHTGSTGYLVALTKSPHRYDLDGHPSGEVSDEHRKAAADELARRRSVHQAKIEQAEEGRRARAALLRAFEQTTLTRANFCALKGIAPEALDALLATAREEAQQARAAMPRPMPGTRPGPELGSEPGRRPGPGPGPGPGPRQGQGQRTDDRRQRDRPPGRRHDAPRDAARPRQPGSASGCDNDERGMQPRTDAPPRKPPTT